MYKDIKGIILDLDGTVLDSSWVWDKVDVKFLGDRGFQVPDDYVEAISPMGAEKAAIYTIERFGLHNEKPKDMVREWFDMAKSEYKEHVICKPYAKDFIKIIHEKSIVGIRKRIDALLSARRAYRSGIHRFFVVVLFDTRKPLAADSGKRVARNQF